MLGEYYRTMAESFGLAARWCLGLALYVPDSNEGSEGSIYANVRLAAHFGRLALAETRLYEDEELFCVILQEAAATDRVTASKG